MRHRDSVGNVGLLVPGSVQWMTAGRGVIHSEMPEQEDGAMEGFQLWLNLPARSKMRDPWYSDIAAGEVPQWHAEGAELAWSAPAWDPSATSAAPNMSPRSGRSRMYRGPQR